MYLIFVTYVSFNFPIESTDINQDDPRYDTETNPYNIAIDNESVLPPPWLIGEGMNRKKCSILAIHNEIEPGVETICFSEDDVYDDYPGIILKI